MRDKLILRVPSKLTCHAARYAHNVSADRALLVFTRDRIFGEVLVISRRKPITGEELDIYGQTLLQLVHARAIDTFQSYFAACIEDALLREPDLLSVDAQISYGEILAAVTLPRLRRSATVAAVRKKVDALAHKGFNEMQRWLKQQGVTLKISRRENDNLREWIAARNIVVHNHGIVNERFIRDVPGTDLTSGESRQFIPNSLAVMQQSLAQLVFSADAAVAERFRIPKRTMRHWQKAYPVFPLPPPPRE